MNARIPQKYYPGLDIGKLMAAVFVIAAHTSPLLSCKNQTILAVYGFFQDAAMPFFFLVSGFLLAVRLDDDLGAEGNPAVLRRYLQRIGKLYLLWNLIYLPITLYAARGKPFGQAARRIIGNFFFVGQQDYSWQLWYLLSVFYAVVLLWIVVKRKGSLRHIGGLAILFLALSLSLTRVCDRADLYSGIFGTAAQWLRRYFRSGLLFTGGFYLTAGFLYGRLRFRPAPWLCLGLLGLGLIVDIFWSPELPGGLRILRFLVRASCLFFLAEGFRSSGPAALSQFCRNTSTALYFTHMIWYFLGQQLLSPKLGQRYYGATAFLWTLGWSLVAAMVLWWGRNSKVVRALL